MSNFHVGQKVVCIDGTVRPAKHRVRLIHPMKFFPIKGQVYTIREMMMGELSGKVCLRFHEIPDEIVFYVYRGSEYEGVPVWEASCFRPLVERKTDISIFTAMLNTQRVRTDA